MRSRTGGLLRLLGDVPVRAVRPDRQHVDAGARRRKPAAQLVTGRVWPALSGNRGCGQNGSNLRFGKLATFIFDEF